MSETLWNLIPFWVRVMIIVGGSTMILVSSFSIYALTKAVVRVIMWAFTGQKKLDRAEERCAEKQLTVDRLAQERDNLMEEVRDLRGELRRVKEAGYRRDPKREVDDTGEHPSI